MKVGAILLALCALLVSAAPAFAHHWHPYSSGYYNNWRFNGWNYNGGWNRFPAYRYPTPNYLPPVYNPGRRLGWYVHNRPWY
jgi:hypothetical protein